jgi:ribosomal protein S18 acetylase RimI-like enzyme
MKNYEHTIQTKFGSCSYSFECDYCHVYNLYVYPAFRHRGKAKELLNMAINKIRAFGYDGEIQIVANPKEDGIDANKLRLFYQRMGFKVFSYYDE